MTRTGLAALCLLTLPLAVRPAAAGEGAHATVQLTGGGIEVSAAEGCVPRTVVSPPGGLFQGTATARLEVNDRGEVTAVSWEPAPPPRAGLAEAALRRWRFDPKSPCPKPFRIALDFPDSELWKYVRGIHQRGATNEAFDEIVRVASVRSGAVLLEFEPLKTGVYRRSYNATYCSRGDSEQAKAMAEEIERKTKVEIERLKALADRDGSGFLSNQEGRALREAWELGQMVAFIQQESPREPLAQRLVRAFPGRPLEDLQAEYDEYLALRAKLVDFGPAIPQLDFSTVDRVR